MKSTAYLFAALMACTIACHAWADDIVFEDTFAGSAGSAPDPAKWVVHKEANTRIELDGQGNVILAGTGQWNQSSLESIYSLPGNGANTYEVEYSIQVPEHAPHYLGLNSLGGAIGPTHQRGFFLQGSTPDFKNTGGVNLTTSIMGHADGALSSDLGIPTDSGICPLNQPIIFRMRLNANGVLAWNWDVAKSTKGLALTAGIAADSKILSKWTRGPGCQYHLLLQANGSQAADKRLIIDRVTVKKLAATQGDTSAVSAGYMENPNIVVQYAGITSETSSKESARIQSKPSPTGSGIWYARDKTEPVTYPPFKGEYYEAKIPDTLDLAERGALGVHGMTCCTDPAADYELYGWMGNPKSGKVTMKHTYHDYNGAEAKWMRQLPVGRTMSGTKENLDIDPKMMETMFRMLGPDGLYYIPVKGMSWQGKPDSVSPWTEPGVEQVFDVAPNGRTIQTLVVWYERNPNDPALKKNIERMIDGLLRIAIKKDGALWIPRHFYDGNPPEDEGPQTGGGAVTSESTMMAGIARYYALTGYEPARQFCEMFARYWLEFAHVLKPNGEWDYSGLGTHFHGTTMTLIGLLEWARASHDAKLEELVRKAYEFGRTVSNPLIGWCPEGYPAYHPNSEPCGIGDMVVLSSMLSADGAGDYWEDVERYTRNLLVEAQVTDREYLEKTAATSGGNAPIEEPYETAKDVANRMQGTFAGMVGITGQFQNVSSVCCTGNGNQGLYFAWRNIVTEKDGQLSVNLLLNRASQWADVDSYLPYQGQVDVLLKKDEKLLVRIPSWVTDAGNVSCSVDGSSRSCKLAGRYLNVGEVKKGEKVSIKFPMPDKKVETTLHWIDNSKKAEKTYTLRIRGFNVVDISPRDTNVIHPFFANPNYRENKVLWKTVTRFAPEQEGYF